MQSFNISNIPFTVSNGKFYNKLSELINKGENGLSASNLITTQLHDEVALDIGMESNTFNIFFGVTIKVGPERVMGHALLVKDLNGKILVEPLKSLPNQPNTLTLAWVFWKYQQVKEETNVKGQSLFKHVLEEAKNNIAETLPNYSEECFVEAKLNRPYDVNINESYLIISLYNPFELLDNFNISLTNPYGKQEESK